MLNWLSAFLFAVLPACPTEDSSNCRWDATRQGNGFGASFITVADHTFLIEVK